MKNIDPNTIKVPSLSEKPVTQEEREAFAVHQKIAYNTQTSGVESNIIDFNCFRFAVEYGKMLAGPTLPPELTDEQVEDWNSEFLKPCYESGGKGDYLALRAVLTRPAKNT